MKKWIALVLCILLLILGCLPVEQTTLEGEPYLLYFRETDLQQVQGGDALRAETVYCQTETDVAIWLMEALLAGPRDEGLKRTIPAGTTLLSLEVEDGRATVDLSANYNNLSDIALTMADYSIALTLTQLPEIRSVRVTVRGQDLAYRDKQVFTPADVLFSSTEDVLGTVTAQVYCLSEDGKLIYEERILELYEGDTQVGVVMEAMQQGPEDRDCQTALPEGFQIRGVWLEDRTCYVNLSSAALPDLPRGGPVQTALWAIARSLCSLETVGEVQFLVDGEFTGTYASVMVATPYAW